METTATTDLVHRNQQLVASNDDLRRANEALVFAAARYLALHDLAPVPLVTVDSAGTMLDINDAAEVLLGAPRAQLLGRALLSFLTDGSRATLAPLMTALFGTGSPASVELTVVRDAEMIDIMVDAIVVPDKGTRRAVLACVDVTPRKRADAARLLLAKQAEEAQRLESLIVLAGGVAHDFNNLMTVVLTGTDIVLHELPDGSPHTEPLLEVRQAARHAGALAHQMLAYSGRVSVPARPLDITAMIRGLEPLIRASSSAIHLWFDLPDDLPSVFGDEAQLRQMVLNLVINAAESNAGRPGAVAIKGRVADGGATIVIEVRDEGMGMDTETQARIFDPYYSTKFAGRGLGLAVVHGVVRGHHGTVTVTSTPGLGTTFRVCLPAAPLARPPVEIPLAAAGPIAGTVLLVDDDELVRRTLARTVRRLGLTVLVADNAAHALAMVVDATVPIDLVITDLTMPLMDGITLARGIRAVRASIPIVLISGFGTMPPDAAGMFADSLAKPFDIATLRAVLQPLLAAPAKP